MRLLLLVTILISSFLSEGQNPEILNKYKYVFIPQLVYPGNKTDVYGIRKATIDKLTSSNVPLFLEESSISKDAMKNPCTMLHCIVNNTASSKGSDFSEVQILFLDCKNDTVLNCSSTASLRSNPDMRSTFIKAIQEALITFNSYRYEYKNTSEVLSVSIPSDNDDSILWSENRKLNWSDFKGVAVSGDPADALTYTAHESGFEAFGVGSRFHVESEVKCYFIKKLSWVKPGMQTVYLLNHEQRHFDLAEVGAREFRKKLRQAQFTSENFQKEVQRITREIDDKYKKLQEEYDRETDHSRTEEKQKEWNKKIDGMLKGLEDYQ
jgi:hypothetical protein